MKWKSATFNLEKWQFWDIQQEIKSETSEPVSVSTLDVDLEDYFQLTSHQQNDCGKSRKMDVESANAVLS